MATLHDLGDDARRVLSGQTLELASWAFGNAGTRFKVYSTPGTPRTPYEKVEDAAQVQRYTGVTPRLSLHIPWDETADFRELAAFARDHGVQLGNVNSNVFQDDAYKFGSLCNSDPAIRRQAIDAHRHCIDVMDQIGSDTLKIWLGDGTNYPGQDSISARQDRLHESLAEIYAALGPDQKLLLEYKFFEPAFYHTDVPDWGTALLQVQALGDRAVVCLDTGHHAPGTNVEFIVVQLLRAGRLGAFDFNSRFYADDDLMVGAADPFQLFRIVDQLASLGALDPETSSVNLMLDQCHQLEPKIPGEIRSALNVQEATAKALLVDRGALAAAQREHDVLGANAVLMDAYNTDVRPLLAELREQKGLDPDPYGAFLRSDYQEKAAAERVGGQQASWGA
ncbi:MAG: L-rhamnose isomerase [Pseudoclavibacter sp.]